MVEEDWGPATFVIKGLLFERTCMACPEQYDVFDGDKQVGYVRLRWGSLRADYPDVHGETVYSASIGDGWTGCFRADAEREEHLTRIAAVLNTKKNLVLIDDSD